MRIKEFDYFKIEVFSFLFEITSGNKDHMVNWRLPLPKVLSTRVLGGSWIQIENETKPKAFYNNELKTIAPPQEIANN